MPRLLYSKHISCILNIYLGRAYYGVYLFAKVSFILAVDTCVAPGCAPPCTHGATPHCTQSHTRQQTDRRPLCFGRGALSVAN